MIEELKEKGKGLALELLKDEEIFEELSDLIITKKISPVADAVLKEKIKPWLEETLPNYVSADDVLDFIKQYAWYSEYINEFVRLLLNVKLFKDSLVKIIGDVFECYDSIINLFGGQCQII